MGVVIMRMHDGRGRLPFHVHVDRGTPKGRIERLGRQPLPAYLWGGEGAVVSTCMREAQRPHRVRWKPELPATMKDPLFFFESQTQNESQRCMLCNDKALQLNDLRANGR
jgi:hypothetical protein